MLDTDKSKEAFRNMVKLHDLTYSYSDDHRAYTRGEAEYQNIRSFANNNLTRKVAAQIWNDEVKLKVRFPEEWMWAEEN